MKKKKDPVLSEQIVSRQLDNGLQIHVLPRRGTASVALQAWVATGSIHEGKYLGYGLSHFLEHMLFQGTREFPGSTISENIAKCGGELNAATSSEYTCVYFNLPPNFLSEGLTMLDSMIREPLLPEDSFQSEREVILRELAMYKDSPLQNLFEKMRMNTLRKHPLRYPTGGFAEQLAEVTPDILRSCHALRYTPGRTFYIAVGDVEPEQVFDLLEKRTANWSRGCMEEPVLPEEPPCIFQRRIQIEFPDPQAYYAASWQSPGCIHPDFIAVNAFSDILGNGDSSRLYEELVNRRMLAQDILFYSHALASIGYSGAVAIAEPDKVHELSARTFDILHQFAAEGPKDEELECLRNNQRTEYLRALQTNDGTAPLIGKSILHYGTPGAIDFYLPELDNLKKEDLIRVGQKYFADSAATLIEQYPAGTLKQRKMNPASPVQHTPVLRQLDSGQKLLFLEDRRLPLANFSILLPGGILNESPDQAGLTRLLAETLSCGNAQYSESEFDRQLELHAIDLNIEAGVSALTLGVTCPAEKLPKAVELICTMLQAPLFPEQAVKRECEILLNTLKTNRMKPESAARDLALHQLFGSHPFGVGSDTLLKTLARIQPENLRDFYRNVCLSAPKAVLGFSGDMSLKDAEKYARKIIRSCSWNHYLPQPFPLPDFPVREKRKTRLLPRQQAVVLTALSGVRSGSPEENIFHLVRVDASSMASRLFQTVRNQNGLVYYAHFTGRAGFGFNGFMGYCGATTAAGIPKLEKIFRQEIHRLIQTGMTSEEFENARKMLLFQLENLQQSPEELLSALVSAEFTGSGWKSIWNRKTALLELTRAAFNRKVKELFAGKKLVTAIVLPRQTQGDKSHENG